MKVNTSLTTINLWGNNIGVEGGKQSEALKVNTSLTKLIYIRIILVMKGKGNRRGIESEYLVD